MSDKDKKQAPHTLHDYSPPEDNQEADTIFPRADSDEEHHDSALEQMTREERKTPPKPPPDQFEPLTPEEIKEASKKFPRVFDAKYIVGNFQTFDYPPDNPDSDVYIPTEDAIPEDELSEREKQFAEGQEQFRKEFKEATEDESKLLEFAKKYGVELEPNQRDTEEEE